MVIDRTVFLYKPYIGCGSTKAIMKIIKALAASDLLIGIIANTAAMRDFYKSELQGHKNVMCFTVQETIRNHTTRGRNFAAIFLLDVNYLKSDIEWQLLESIRTPILFKEIDGTYPNEIYN
jgi:hypothetical protein